jgi:hypothetical protein
MKTFLEAKDSLNEVKHFREDEFSWLNESERAQAEELYQRLSEHSLEELEKPKVVVALDGDEPEGVIEDIKKILSEKEISAGVTECEGTVCVFPEDPANLASIQEILSKEGGYATKIEEGLLGSIIGGITGFLVGPAIGKVIANALGIEKGIFYDMFTSRLAGAALGAAITKYIGGKKS